MGKKKGGGALIAIGVILLLFLIFLGSSSYSIACTQPVNNMTNVTVNVTSNSTTGSCLFSIAGVKVLKAPIVSKNTVSGIGGRVSTIVATSSSGIARAIQTFFTGKTR
jgi:hypothetical protein